MTKTVCDLCGEEILSPCENRYKIKKFWSDPYGSGWDKLDAHRECIEAVAASARAAKEKE